MTRVSWYKKGLVVGIIVLFIGVSISSSTAKIVSTTCQTTIFNGSLLGYVNDTSGNPIEGALVMVFFHDSFRMDFSDEDGYYHVTSIPICYCMKDTVCSKSGYKSEQVSLAITENTVHDFILTPNEAITSSLSGSEDCIECQVSDDYPVICTMLYTRWMRLSFIWVSFYELTLLYKNNLILYEIFLLLTMVYQDRVLYIEEQMEFYNCDYSPI